MQVDSNLRVGSFNTDELGRNGPLRKVAAGAAW